MGDSITRKDWKQVDKHLFFDLGHRRLGIVADHGQGSYLWDIYGKKYLDFVGGWAVTSLGHSHPVLVNALKEQAEKLMICSADIANVPQIELARELLEATRWDFRKVFFSNSGAEANEAAIKLARKWGKLHRSGAYEVISALNSFHGRTLAMVAATGRPSYQAPFTPLPGGFVNVPYDDVEAIQAATTKNTVAVLLEPIQGEGGVIIPQPNYLKKVRDWCDKKGLLLILDEVQTGCGRTGSMFAYQSSGVVPDIMTVGKGLGGGIPIAGMLATEQVAVFGPGDHGSTYGGNPLSCAVALANLRFIREFHIATQAQEKGELLKTALRSFCALNFVREVRGQGLLIAVELGDDRAAAVVREAVDLGLLLNLCRPNIVRMMPPLTVSLAEMEEGVELFNFAIARVIG